MPSGGTPAKFSPKLPAVRLLTQAVKAVRPDRGGIRRAYWSEIAFLIKGLAFTPSIARPANPLATP